MGVSNCRLLELPVEGGRTCELRETSSVEPLRRSVVLVILLVTPAGVDKVLHHG
jgi:hypothetical protein